jgi:hypothetical protein
MVYLCVIVVLKGRMFLNPYLFIMFCNVIDCDMLVNMSTLISPIITIGYSTGIFFKIVSKSK